MFQQKGKESSSSARVHPASHVNYRYLSDNELKARLHNLHREVRCYSMKLERMKRKLEEIADTHGSELDSRADQDIRQIMRESAASIRERYPSNSFQRLFFEQQLKAASLRDARQMRWHPAMVKWCLYIRHRSSGTYETLRKSGCIFLPSQRTLRDYTHVASSRIGFSSEVDTMLVQTSKILTSPEHERFVAVVYDEMHIKADLVYNKHTGELVGFCNIGDINNTLLQVEKSLEEKDPRPELAKSMLVYMVRGLCGSLQFPYAQFSTRNISGESFLFIVITLNIHCHACR